MHATRVHLEAKRSTKNPDRLYTVSEIFIWVSQFCTKQVLLVKDWSHGAVPENYDGEVINQLKHSPSLLYFESAMQVDDILQHCLKNVDLCF